eukprot:COSAG01_NODE_13844_length_1527_cov_4.035014_2_plen_83_part_01
MGAGRSQPAQQGAIVIRPAGGRDGCMWPAAAVMMSTHHAHHAHSTHCRTADSSQSVSSQSVLQLCLLKMTHTDGLSSIDWSII